MVAGVLGGGLGVVGGLVGTAVGVATCHGPRERATALWLSAAMWAVLAVDLAGWWLLRPWGQPLGLLPLLVLMPPVRGWAERRLAAARQADGPPAG